MINPILCADRTIKDEPVASCKLSRGNYDTCCSKVLGLPDTASRSIWNPSVRMGLFSTVPSIALQERVRA